MIFNFYEVTPTQLNTFVHLYCNNNFTLKMTAMEIETCW